jgi:hypothetical protein
MPNKNLDGIRKISGQELERARRIILESIGEKDSNREKKEIFGSVLKKGKSMDSLSAASGPLTVKKNPIKEKRESVQKKKAGIEKNPRLVVKNQNFSEKKNKIIESQKSTERELKMIVENEKEELNKKKEKEKLDFAREEKMRKEKEKARKAKKIKKEIRREVRMMQWEKFKNRIKENWLKSVKIFVFSALFAGITIVIFYLIFCLLLLRFNVDNKITRQLSKHFPVPAVIAQEGWIEYYNYLNITSGLESRYKNPLELQQVKMNRIVEKIALAGLAKRYNLNLENKTSENIIKEINLKLATDKKKNEVSISRIAKIKELIIKSSEAEATGGQGENFEGIGKKYGDEQGYWVNNQGDSRFSDVLGKLEIGEASNITIADDGYYIFTRDENGFKYIFIKSMTFSNYLESLSAEMKIWILAQ